MGLLREEVGSHHLAIFQRSPQFYQALRVFCSGLTKAYDDAHLDYKEEIAAVFDKAEEESDRSATAAPAPAPFVPDPTQSPQVNAIREQSHRIEQEISAMQDRMSERREPAREDDAAARRLGDMSAIVHDTTIAKLDESQITKLIANFTLSICGIADSSSSNAAVAANRASFSFRTKLSGLNVRCNHTDQKLHGINLDVDGICNCRSLGWDGPADCLVVYSALLAEHHIHGIIR
jgi:hypothetical protein